MDKRRLFPIFTIILVTFLGATIVLPSLPLYTKHRFGASDSLITLLNASFYAAQFLAAPWLGRLSDKYGRLPVLIYSQVGTVLSFILMASAQNIGMMFAARILDGITGGNVIVAQAYITDVTPREHRTRALGLVWAAFGIGYTVGPAIGGGLNALFQNDAAAFYAGAIISTISVLLTIFMLKESLSAEERLARRARSVTLSPRDVMHNTALLLILFLGFSTQFSLSMLTSTFPLFGEEVIFRGQTPHDIAFGVGLLLGAIGIGQVITQVLLVKHLVVWLGERRMVVLGTALRAVSLFALVLFASPLLIGLVLLVFAIGSGMKMPSLNSMATTSVSERVNGAVIGLYGASTSLGLILGSVFSGLLFEMNPYLPYLLGGVLMVFLLIPATMLMRQTVDARGPVAVPAVGD